ncbi:MAG: hypothetical protein ACREUF_03025 [Solimonas sp.]
MNYAKDTESHPGKIVYRSATWQNLSTPALIFDPNAPEGERCSLLIKPGLLPDAEAEVDTYLTEV